jgi:SAM-dependent methyltransferase
VSDSDLILDTSYANRIDALFYSKSDEKFTVRALLDDIFGNRKFERALDVGPGLGHITEPLARRTKHLVLVEPMAEYEEALKQQFSNATVIVAPFGSARLTGKFDLILCSHVLYYQHTSTWLSFCQKLLELLSDDGELLIIMNSDVGDWWKIMHHYSATLGGQIGFHYEPMSQFKRELSAIASVHTLQYRYQVWIEPGATWADFIGRQILELRDEAVLKEHEQEFTQFAKQFKQVDGSVVMDFRSEILRVRKRV